MRGSAPGKPAVDATAAVAAAEARAAVAAGKAAAAAAAKVAAGPSHSATRQPTIRRPNRQTQAAPHCWNSLTAGATSRWAARR